MKKIFLIIILITSFKIVSAKELVSLVNCVDGDTAVLKIANEDRTIRLLAIDTPETVHPSKGEEDFGKEASDYTCNRLSKASKIEIEYDPKSNKRDKYDRELVWVFVDDNLLQDELINYGYGKVAYIYGDYEYVPSLCRRQKDAIDNKLGLWSIYDDEEYCKTIDYSNASYINEYIENKNNKSNELILYIIIITAIIILVCINVITKKEAKRIIKRLIK